DPRNRAPKRAQSAPKRHHFDTYRHRSIHRSSARTKTPREPRPRAPARILGTAALFRSRSRTAAPADRLGRVLNRETDSDEGDGRVRRRARIRALWRKLM